MVNDSKWIFSYLSYMDGSLSEHWKLNMINNYSVSSVSTIGTKSKERNIFYLFFLLTDKAGVNEYFHFQIICFHIFVECRYPQVGVLE